MKLIKYESTHSDITYDAKGNSEVHTWKDAEKT